MRSPAALLPFPKIMKIFNIPFPPRAKSFTDPPHRRPTRQPQQNRSLTFEPRPVSHFRPHLSRNPLRTPPGVPFPAPPVPKSPPNPARCPAFSPTCHASAGFSFPVVSQTGHRPHFAGIPAKRFLGVRFRFLCFLSLFLFCLTIFALLELPCGNKRWRLQKPACASAKPACTPERLIRLFSVRIFSGSTHVSADCRQTPYYQLFNYQTLL